MVGFNIRLGVWGLAVLVAGGSARAVDNPLPVALDGAFAAHNGRYYALSGQTNGQMLVSENLVDWRPSAQALPAEVAGPYELAYRNGLFYLYAEGQGFTVSDRPDAPFPPLRKAALSGEQMRLFQDKGGALFSVNRRQGSKKEGEIWLQPYSSPWSTAGRAQQLLDGRRGMWDSLDSADLGEPELIDYRGNYYLLYAANNPSPRTGLREIGVAVNENPLKFSNPDKLSGPVLVRNADRLARTYAALLPSGEYSGWEGRYTTKAPAEGWNLPDANLAGWRTGKGGFGHPDEVDGAHLHACRTKWDEDEIWVRREFNLKTGTPKTPVLNLRHEGAVQVFLNGRLVHESLRPSVAYANFDLAEVAAGLFRPEGNVLAVHAKVPAKAPFRFLDFGLFDAGSHPVEPAVYAPNAPRMLEGPNGFEKWVAYRAWWNGEPGTGLDRLFFYKDELVVDGPTTRTTPGYHPPPAKPTFHDAFPEDEGNEWVERWHFSGGAWIPVDGALRQSDEATVAKAYLRREPATHYLFETQIRFSPSGKGGAGIVAWSNGETDLVMSIDPAAGSWEYSIAPGSLAPKRFKLPPGFKVLEKPPGVGDAALPFQRLRVVKNGGYFDVWLNDIQLTADQPIVTTLAGSGVPGLYCRQAAAEFDGVVYTVGWDEHNEYITGWGDAADGTASSGEWRLDKEYGLVQNRHSETGLAFKGDLLDQYEFTVNAELEKLEEGKERLYGVFPLFVDRNNFIKAMIDTRERKLVVSGKRNGIEIASVSKPLRDRIPLRHLYDTETSYRDVAAWVYRLRSESIVTALDIRWLEGEYDHLQQEFFVPVDDMLVRYAKLKRGREPILWDDGRFFDADEPKPAAQLPGVHNHVAIRPEEGNYVGFGFQVSSSIVIDSETGRYIRDYIPGEDLGPNEMIGDDTTESDTMSRPQETLVTVEVESSYFFRCVKLKDRLVIELNGRPMVDLAGAWPAAQVGLVTEGQPCYFNGITLMHLPTE